MDEPESEIKKEEKGKVSEKNIILFDIRINK